MRVLVIEHHPLMARALKQGLEEEGFAVTLALTREEGDCHARDPHFDAVILDPGHGQEDPPSLLRRWRRQGFHTPVLVLAARSSLPDDTAGPEGRADAYLTKPFPVEELFSWLLALARRRD